MKRIDFENGTITQNILGAALPMLVAQLLNLLYNIVDRVYIGKIPGEGTLALDGQTARWQGSRAAAVLHCLGDGAALTARKAPYAREYNKLLEGDALTVRRTASDFNWFVTVLQLQPDAAAPELTAELLPVHKLRLQTPLTDAQAQAVRLVCSGQETVVLVCHGEVISEVDLLAAGNYAAYGKAIVFDAAHPQGLCLAW